MSSVSVLVNTNTFSVTYVSDNILRSLKDIIRASGLDPSHLADQYDVISRGLRVWIESKHLECVVLEVFDPKTDALVTRWDIDIDYGWSHDHDGNFWVDTEGLNYAIRKAGVWPSSARYRVVVSNKSGAQSVDGWSGCSLRSTDGFVKQSIGTTISHSGLGAGTSYYRKEN